MAAHFAHHAAISSNLRQTLAVSCCAVGQGASWSRPETYGGLPVKKLVLALAASATIAAATLSAPAPAQAGCVGCWIGAGVAGGLVAGAIIGSAARPYYYGPGPGYYYGPGPAPVYYAPACRWVRQRFWDGYAWNVRSVRVCR